MEVRIGNVEGRIDAPTSDSAFRTSHLRILLGLRRGMLRATEDPAGHRNDPPGATLDAAIDSLSAHDVIRNPARSMWYARLRGWAARSDRGAPAATGRAHRATSSPH